MNIVIRTDASIEIGTGHVMRCLTLADALRKYGARVAFLSRTHRGHLCDLIAKKGYEVHRLPVENVADDEPSGLQHATWLGASQERDAQMCAISIPPATDWLIVDHYALDVRWERALRPHVRNIMAIDDLADRRHDCDVLHDQNYYQDVAGRYDGLLPPGCKKLLGPRYAMLRTEFVQSRTQEGRDGRIRRIFVFFGGSDLTGQTINALKAIESLNNPEISVDVVVGANNPHRDAIEHICRRLRDAHLHVQVENMAELMSRADLALGAGGTANWERAALGLPSITLGLAANQRPIIRDMANDGALIGFVDADALTVEDLARAVRFSMDQPGLMRHLSSQSRKLVDAKGTERVVNVLRATRVILRPATMQDSDNLFAWRNSPEVRESANNTDPIALADHTRWLSRTLADETKALLIGEADGRPIGVIRFDMEANQALVSIYLRPGCTGNGYGTGLLWAGERWLKKNQPQLQVVNAEVKPWNRASEGAFIKAGYAVHRTFFQKKMK